MDRRGHARRCLGVLQCGRAAPDDSAVRAGGRRWPTVTAVFSGPPVPWLRRPSSSSTMAASGRIGWLNSACVMVCRLRRGRWTGPVCVALPRPRGPSVTMSIIVTCCRCGLFRFHLPAILGHKMYNQSAATTVGMARLFHPPSVTPISSAMTIEPVARQIIIRARFFMCIFLALQAISRRGFLRVRVKR